MIPMVEDISVGATGGRYGLLKMVVSEHSLAGDARLLNQLIGNKREEHEFPDHHLTNRLHSIRPVPCRSLHLAGCMTALNAAAAHKMAKNVSVSSNRHQGLISMCIRDPTMSYRNH
jgi:hypothetical protein